LGIALTKNGAYDRSIDCFEKTLRIFLHDFGEAHPQVANLHAMLGQSFKLKKDVARLEKQLLKLDEAINALVEEQSSAAFDAERLIEITAKLEELRADKNTKEEEWLFATTALDN
jgi:tetratricopeptide (TPR) repeat protein